MTNSSPTTRFSVTCEAALTYCKWLTDTTGRSFRLPSEAEWEYVSGGIDHRQYQWGEHFEPGRANTIEMQMRGTTPVGMFARGHSPFGVMDMAANKLGATNRYQAISKALLSGIINPLC